MPYNAAKLAIRKRFAQAHLNTPGIGVQAMPSPHTEQAPTFSVSDSGDESCGPVQVLVPKGTNPFYVMVYSENRDGHLHEHPRTVVFSLMRDRTRKEELGFQHPVVETLGCAEVMGPDGTIRSGPSLVREVRAPRPISLYFNFEVESRKEFELGYLMNLVDALFPYRGSLDIRQASGAVRNVQMLRTTHWYRTSPFNATLTPGDPGVRSYRMTCAYEVQAYEDLSVALANSPWQPTILRPVAQFQLMEDGSPIECVTPSSSVESY